MLGDKVWCWQLPEDPRASTCTIIWSKFSKIILIQSHTETSRYKKTHIWWKSRADRASAAHRGQEMDGWRLQWRLNSSFLPRGPSNRLIRPWLDGVEVMVLCRPVEFFHTELGETICVDLAVGAEALTPWHQSEPAPQRVKHTSVIVCIYDIDHIS